MLSLSLSSPNISFNLYSSSSPQLQLSHELQTLRNIPTSGRFYTHSFLCYHSNPIPSSLRKFQNSEYISIFSEDPDSDSPSIDEKPQSLCPSLLAFWLRSCRSLRDVKKLHSVALRRLGENNTYFYNNLISIYLRLGELSYARNVFDEMPYRNVVTWTAIINGYLRFGFDGEALKLLEECVGIGIRPNENTFTCALNLCCERTDLNLGRQIHAGVLKSGRRSKNRIVDSAVVKLYDRCGDLVGARRAFERTPNKDMISWTSIISAYSRHKHGAEALSLFISMIGQGFSPNEFTLPAAINATSEDKFVRLGRELHCAAIKLGYGEKEVFVGTSLVDMYAKCGEIGESRLVFDSMEKRNTATWTAIVTGYARAGLGAEALSLFREMNSNSNSNLQPNRLTLVGAVRACGLVGTAGRILGRELHARALRDPRVGTALHVGSTLVWFYCRFGDYEAAERVLRTMPRRDVVSWTAMVSGLAGFAGMELEALKMIVGPMADDGVAGNEYTASAALKACAVLEAGLCGRAVHTAANKRGWSSENAYVGSALIHMYARCGRVANASTVFDSLPERSPVSWRSMIIGFARNGLGQEALSTMNRMQAKGFEVDEYVRTIVLNACG